MDLWVFFKKPIHVMTTSPLRHFFVTKKKQNALKYGWMRWVWEEFSDLKIPKLLLELSADGFTPFGGCPHLHHSREPPVEGRKEVGAMEGRKEEGGQRGELGRSRGRKKREAHRMSVNNNTPPPLFFFFSRLHLFYLEHFVWFEYFRELDYNTRRRKTFVLDRISENTNSLP